MDVAQDSLMSADAIPCHRCGYDVRAQSLASVCPECATPIEESRRFAAIPRAPAWSASDPHWRRKLVAGAWLLVFIPAMAVLEVLDIELPVPRVFDYLGTVVTHNDTLLSDLNVFQPLMFGIGMLLLFSHERGRLRNRLDWTRKWGVMTVVFVVLLSAASVLFIAALVLVGIAAVFQSLPPAHQPSLTPTFVDVSYVWLRYGPHPMRGAAVTQVAFSSIAVLLACIPLWGALCRAGSRRMAVVLLMPLVACSIWYLIELVRYMLASTAARSDDVFRFGIYFWPQGLLAFTGRWSMFGSTGFAPVIEATKWGAVLLIALWLTAAQILARVRGHSTKDAARRVRAAEAELKAATRPAAPKV